MIVIWCEQRNGDNNKIETHATGFTTIAVAWSLAAIVVVVAVVENKMSQIYDFVVYL